MIGAAVGRLSDASIPLTLATLVLSGAWSAGREARDWIRLGELQRATLPSGVAVGFTVAGAVQVAQMAHVAASAARML